MNEITNGNNLKKVKNNIYSLHLIKNFISIYYLLFINFVIILIVTYLRLPAANKVILKKSEKK